MKQSFFGLPKNDPVGISSVDRDDLENGGTEYDMSVVVDFAPIRLFLARDTQFDRLRVTESATKKDASVQGSP